VDFDPSADYPLGSRRPDLVVTPAGTPLAELSLDALRAGRISGDELRATSETLHRQSQVALAAGRRALADNLARGAELASVPDPVILEVYTALRPHRSTADELEQWAERLEADYGARLSAAFVRDAVAVYAERGLLASQDERAELPAV
jgi:propanediol dehydratase small subunit